MKYPVYIEVTHNYLPDDIKCVRFLANNGDDVVQIVYQDKKIP